VRTAPRRTRTTRRSRIIRLLTAFAALVGAVVLGTLAPASAQARAPRAAAPAAAAPAAAATGLHISNGRLIEGNGNDFIMRGVNHAYTWYTGQSIDTGISR
jgi:mannan endo-1,4-beta-mannosidase